MAESEEGLRVSSTTQLEVRALQVVHMTPETAMALRHRADADLKIAEANERAAIAQAEAERKSAEANERAAKERAEAETRTAEATKERAAADKIIAEEKTKAIRIPVRGSLWLALLILAVAILGCYTATFVFHSEEYCMKVWIAIAIGAALVLGAGQIAKLVSKATGV